MANDHLQSLKQEKDRLIADKTKLEEKIKVIENNSLVNNDLLKNKESNLAEYKQKADKLEVELKAAKENNDLLKRELNDRLEPLAKINKTFFDKSGNKGKGELGEEAIEVILSKAGVENEF